MNPWSVHFSEHLYASDLHGSRTSVSSGDKNLCDLKVHQTPFSHTRDESELDPDRDIELELRALNMEDSEPQDVKSQVVFFSPPKCWYFFFFLIHLILSMWRENLKKTHPVSLNPSSFFSLRSLLIWRAHNLRMLPTSSHLPAYPPSFHPLQRSSPKQRIQWQKRWMPTSLKRWLLGRLPRQPLFYRDCVGLFSHLNIFWISRWST